MLRFTLMLLALALHAAPPSLVDPRESRLLRVRQLTFEGSNAEAYWSFDGKRIVFQSTREGHGCDQLYVMNADGSGQRRVSSGQGRVTCGYWLPDGQSLVYASTQGSSPACPEVPPFTPGRYQWPVHAGYELYRLDLGSGKDHRVVPSAGYDAEATVAPNGKWMVFTSERSGDIDLWRCNLDGSDLRQLTREVGYDGGAFFSPDSRSIVWRTNHPKGAEAVARYRDLLKQHLVEPMAMDIWVMDADGGHKRQLTHLPGAAFAPVFTPDGQAILFASNHHDQEGRGRNFDLFKVDLQGGAPERITYTGGFNSFPHFSPDGRRLLWCSGRNASNPRQFNIFVADWDGSDCVVECCPPKGKGRP